MSTTRKIKADYVDGVFTQLNYIDTSTANDKITLWNRFLDTAASRPVDGTGGSPSANVTWTRTTSDPIQGEGSFLYSKLNGVNTQGEGVSRDITIPSGQKAREQTFSFDYRIASGTYSGGTSSTDSDLIAYIYRTTATGRLIEPSVIKLDGAVVGVNYSYRGEFQTDSDATGYRIIIYSATTSTSNFTVQFDNFYVGPSKNVTGAITTQPLTYVPTITATTSNPTKSSSPDIDIATWYRNGKYMHIQYNYRQSNNTGAAAGSGTYLFSIPSGYTIDTAFLETGAFFGSNAVGTAAGYATATGTGYAYPYNSTNIAIFLSNETSSGTVTSSFYALSNATARYSFDVIIPIVGWGATATLGQDADTRVVAMRATSSSTSLASGAATTAINATLAHDTHGAYNTGTGIYTVPVAGFYQLSASAELSKAWQAQTYFITEIKVNGTTRFYGLTASVAAVASTTFVSQCGGSVLLKAGDLVRLDVTQTATGTTSLDASATANFLCVERASGPSQIAASEQLNLKYVNTAGTSVTSAGVDIPFATKVYDTHGTYDGTTFTANSAGKYEFSANLFSANVNQTTTQSFNLIFLVTATPEGLSGAAQTKQVNYGNGASKAFTVNATDTYNMIAGDTLKVRAASDTTVALSTTGGRNYLIVKKLGGIG